MLMLLKLSKAGRTSIEKTTIRPAAVVRRNNQRHISDFFAN